MTLTRTVRVSRAELAVLLGVVVIVFSLAGSALTVLQRERRAATVRSDLRALLEAGRRFYAEYGAWPTAQAGDYGDCRYGRRIPNAEVMNALRAVDGPGNAGHALNTRRIVFFHGAAQGRRGAGLADTGDFLDPWGRPYQIVLDADLDNACDIEASIYGRRAGEGMVVWSCGPDRVSDTKDDILSWTGRALIQ
ncbi:MAG: hypothetical protein JXB04_12320 [Kiritimatiellae bacterium]|nr:hypothetical protein [Kiritimatiellia bacterium]